MDDDVSRMLDSIRAEARAGIDARTDRLVERMRAAGHPTDEAELLRTEAHALIDAALANSRIIISEAVDEADAIRRLREA